MRKIALFLFLSLFFLPKMCLATMSASITWEFRDSSTANMVNGGGFVTGASGTDYSLQDTAQWTAADGTSNASTTFTSASMTFTSAIIGNVLHLTAGTNGTVGWYEVTGYTDANTITLDRNCSTGAMTNGTFYVGGALSLNSTLDDDFFEQCVAGQIVYFKGAVTYTLGEAISTAIDGTASNLINVEGYNTTRGDNPISTNRPTLACGATGFGVGDYWYIRNIIFTGTGTSVAIVNDYSLFENCKSTNTSATTTRNAFYLASAVGAFVVNCEGSSTVGDAVDTDGASSGDRNFIIGNYLHDSTNGIQINSAGHSILFNIIDTCTTGIKQLATARIQGNINSNTIYNCTTGIIGLDWHSVKILNNIIDTCTTGISWDTTNGTNPTVFLDYNNFFGNTTDVSNVTKGDHDTALTPGFTDAPNADFRVGADMKATAFPGTFPGAGASCIGYLDQGAVQRVEPAGGTSNDVFGIM